MKLIVDVISKRNVFWKKFLATFVFAGCRKIVEQKSMKNHLEESKDEHLEMTAVKCKTVGAELNYLKLVIAKISPKPIFNQPPDINMTDFEGCKKRGERWYSPAFYSHVGGYKMGLCIYANGWASGKGTHVSVAVHMMKGEFDSHLKWAFRGEITVELVNQTFQRNTTSSIKLSDSNDKFFKGVTEGDKAAVGRGEPEFISHSDLYNPEEGNEYIPGE